MRRIKLLLIVLIVVSTGLAQAQSSSRDVPVILEKLYGRLLKDTLDNERQRINDSIKVFIESYVSSDSVFTTRFSNLRYLGQITSPDSLVKIVTWNLFLKDSPGRYFCYLIRKNPKEPGNTIFNLTANYDSKPIITDTVYTQKNWYGALYYDIKPFTSNNRKSWVLLGINFGDPLITRKIIEVLNFTPGNKIVFGRRWFDSGSEIKYRDVFGYASNGIMSMKFATDNSIVFDHLVPFMPFQADDRQFYGPDYSYDAYMFSNGLWTLSVNVDARNK